LKKKKIKIASNRSFGIIFAIIFLLISLWPIRNSEGIYILPLIISLLFLFLGIIKAKILSPFKKLWIKTGIILGIFITPIVMGIIFFIVVTPTAILLRLFGKDVLHLKNNNSESYWINKDKTENSMKNQF